MGGAGGSYGVNLPESASRPPAPLGAARNPEAAGSNPAATAKNALKSCDFRAFSLFSLEHNLGQRFDPCGASQAPYRLPLILALFHFHWLVCGRPKHRAGRGKRLIPAPLSMSGQSSFCLLLTGRLCPLGGQHAFANQDLTLNDRALVHRQLFGGYMAADYGAALQD